MADQDPAIQGDSPAPTKRFTLLNVFLKDLSFEAPQTPQILYGHGRPEIQISMESQHKLRDKDKRTDVFDVILETTVHVTAEDKSLFLIELKQGGVFEIAGYSTEETLAMLKTKALETLYPYARELISSLASRGGFPRLNLRWINFEDLYAEAQKSRKKA